MTRPARRRVVAGGIALLLAGVVLLPLCDLVFDCGCTWFFLGGEAHCNMHAPQPPHCPLCTGSWLYGLAFVVVTWTALFLPLDRVLRPRS